MTNKGYTTEALIEAFLNESITEASSDITTWIVAVQNFIDKYTQRNFKADTSESARLYNGNDKLELLIDDCVEITKVEYGNDFYGTSKSEISEYTAGGSTDAYITYPENAIIKNKPIRKLVLLNRYWIGGFKNQQITARWGYSVAVPEDIKYLATMLVAGIYKKGRSGGIGGVGSEKIGQYSVSYDVSIRQILTDEAKQILDNYKKVVI